ncbi:unnamed protein product [Ectocarpus sp. CCAP 1310/34]|nr:unnamed protein product [Ectocarpus sp. CCAP 1310/34]
MRDAGEGPLSGQGDFTLVGPVSFKFGLDSLLDDLLHFLL